MHNPIKKALALITAAVMLIQPSHAAWAYESRDEIPAEYKWKVTDVFADKAAFGAELENAAALIEGIKAALGTLNDKAGVLSLFKEMDAAKASVDKLYLYTAIKLDINYEDAEADSETAMADALDSELNYVYSGLVYELAGKEPAVLNGYLADPDFAGFAPFIRDALSEQKYGVTELAYWTLYSGDYFEMMPWRIYTAFSSGDLESLPEDETDPKTSYESLRASYAERINTMAALVSAEVNKNLLYAGQTNLTTMREYWLQPDIPGATYDVMVNGISANLSAYHRMNALRKTVSGLDVMYEYDKDTGLFPREKELGYEDAKAAITAALSPLGDEYSAAAAKAFGENWIDVYASPGRTEETGAWRAHSPHSFIAMDFDGSEEAAESLALYLGYAVQQYFASQNNTFAAAEVEQVGSLTAPHVNNLLLLRYWADNAGTNAEKLSYLWELAELYEEKVYEAAMMADFLGSIYLSAEAGETLSAGTLNWKWQYLSEKYNGSSLTSTGYTKFGWAEREEIFFGLGDYISIMDFAAANRVVSGLLAGEAGLQAKYAEYLKSGSNLSPLETLKIIGVDLNGQSAYADIAKSLDGILTEIENLLKTM